MKKIIMFLFIFFCFNIFAEDLKDPEEPVVESKFDKIDTSKYNLKYKKQDGYFYKGYMSPLTGFYLENLVWDGNSQGNQQILIDLVKSIYVKGYKMYKKTTDNLSVVYYFPYIFEIKMRDGKIFTGVNGRINKIESFDIWNDVGKEKAYMYFVRYWLEDKQMFNDNNSADFEEKPPVPKEVVTFIEFE